MVRDLAAEEEVTVEVLVAWYATTGVAEPVSAETHAASTILKTIAVEDATITAERDMAVTVRVIAPATAAGIVIAMTVVTAIEAVTAPAIARETVMNAVTALATDTRRI